MTVKKHVKLGTQYDAVPITTQRMTGQTAGTPTAARTHPAKGGMSWEGRQEMATMTDISHAVETMTTCANCGTTGDMLPGNPATWFHAMDANQTPVWLCQSCADTPGVRYFSFPPPGRKPLRHEKCERQARKDAARARLLAWQLPVKRF